MLLNLFSKDEYYSKEVRIHEIWGEVYVASWFFFNFLGDLDIPLVWRPFLRLAFQRGQVELLSLKSAELS